MELEQLKNTQESPQKSEVAFLAATTQEKREILRSITSDEERRALAKAMDPKELGEIIFLEMLDGMKAGSLADPSE